MSKLEFIRQSDRNTASRAFLAAFLLLLLVHLPGHAQVSRGALSGSITDQSGAATPNAQVSVTDLATGATRTATTDTRGFYTVADLAADSYEMTVSAPGFTTQVRTEIALAVGANVIINVTMKAGNPQQIERMAAADTQANQTSSAVGKNVSSSTVVDSPLNGRDWTQLATLQAGVTGVQTGSSGGGNSTVGFGAALSISGARPDQNNYRLDGISINDYSNGAPGSVLGENLGVDAVEQFSVLGSNYPAEYGRTSGGVINAVTRGGTKSFHGDIYEFLRNSALDARNFFDRPIIPSFRRNQFGGSAGAPIRRDRTFVFADYEGLRQSLGVTHVDTVPSLAARNGQLSTGTVSVDPAVARFLSTFYPLPDPNSPLLAGGDTGRFTFAGQQVIDENYVTVKLDHKFSGQDNFSGTYMRDNSEVVQPNAFDSLLSNTVSAREVATLHEQHLFNPKFLNAVRFGFNRAVAVNGGVSQVINPAVVDPSFGFIPGQFVGAIVVPGITSLPAGPVVGLLSGSSFLHWNSFQGGDDVLLIKGAHALQFGVVVERMQDNTIQTGLRNGSFTFSRLSDFLTNLPLNFQGSVPIPLTVFGTRQTIFGGYMKDDIRVRRNLTLTLGLRYEMATVPTEVHNSISNLMNLTDAQPHIGSPYFLNPTLKDFEPRVGFAWDPLGKGKTAVRGGFGMFDVLPLPYMFRLTTPYAAPFAEQLYVDTLPPAPGSFPTQAFTQFASTPGSARASYVQHAPKRDYVMQWNLNVAQELSSSVTATIAYVGSRGVHLPFRMDNFDTVLPTLTPAGYLYPPSATSQTLNPNFGRITGTVWQGNSFYDALQADVAKRMGHGFTIHAAYTFGKSMDTLSSTVADDAYPNVLYNPLFFDQRTSRGLSDFNVAQTFVVSFTWQLPSPAGRQDMPSAAGRWLVPVKWAASGWQLGGIYKASGGQPFTPTLGGDPLGTKLDQFSEPPNVIAGPGCDTLVNPGNPNHYIKTQCLAFPSPANLRGNLGRNVLIGPGISKFDFSVFKNNRIFTRSSSSAGCAGAGCRSGNSGNLFSEGFNVQFRAEFFNVFNRANFASPTDNLTVFDQSGNPISSAGLITFTQTTSRQIQFAIKVIW